MEKRLYRVRRNRMIAGVCGGFAEYFDIDPTIVRIIAVAVGLAFGTGFIAYIIAAIIIPEGEYGYNKSNSHESGFNEQQGSGFNTDADEWKQSPKYDSGKGKYAIGIILIFLGLAFLLKQFFGWLDMKFILPLILIGIGALIISRSRRS